MAKNLAAGAQQQAGAGGPVKTPEPLGTKSAQGSTTARTAAVHAAHASESAPGAAISKAAGHLKSGGGKK